MPRLCDGSFIFGPKGSSGNIPPKVCCLEETIIPNLHQPMKSAVFALLVSALVLSGCDTLRPAGSAEGSSGVVNGTAGVGMKF